MSYTICRLKVILKKAKPPVWVQTEVPLGITFSALSVLLDLAAGEFLPLYGNAGDECPPPFEFESASENVQLREGIFEKDDRPVWNRDLREADTTFVDEYLTAGSWFTYRPDRSAERSYRVEVLDFFHSEYGMPMLGKYSRGADAYYGAQENWYQRRAMLAMRWQCRRRTRISGKRRSSGKRCGRIRTGSSGRSLLWKRLRAGRTIGFAAACR